MIVNKQWNDGGSLSVTYDGDRDGSAVFSSEQNEGIDREMSVAFIDAVRQVNVARTVKQIGMREPFSASNGRFILKNGGTFNVLKEKRYTKLPYIECTGSQYIDLPYIVKETDIIEMHLEETVQAAENRWLFCAADATNAVWCSTFSAELWSRFGYSDSEGQYTSEPLTFVRLQKGKVASDKGETALSYAAMPDCPLRLFADRRTETASGFGQFKVRSFTITDGNGNIVMKLVPCRRETDNRLGLYDNITGAFYTNMGTGDFSYMDSAYTQLEYVNGDGSNYIDTGFIPSSTSRLILDIETTKVSGVALYVFGIASAETNKKYQMRAISSSTTYTIDYGASSKSSSFTAGGRASVDFGKGNVTIGGNTISLSTTAFECSSTLRLLYGLTSSGSSRTSPGKIYSCKIYDNDSLVRDMIPVQDASGVEGLYDKINNVFHPLITL